jgi:hypothetical protein
VIAIVVALKNWPAVKVPLVQLLTMSLVKVSAVPVHSAIA